YNNKFILRHFHIAAISNLPTVTFGIEQHLPRHIIYYRFFGCQVCKTSLCNNNVRCIWNKSEFLWFYSSIFGEIKQQLVATWFYPHKTIIGSNNHCSSLS